MSRSMVASRSVAAGGVLRLERAARLAGESFGHEEALAVVAPHSGRWLWWLAATAALAGLVLLSLR